MVRVKMIDMDKDGVISQAAVRRLEGGVRFAKYKCTYSSV